MSQPSPSTTGDSTPSRWEVLGCLLIPIAFGLGLIAIKANSPWLTYPALVLLVLALGFKARAAFTMPARSAEGLVGGIPKEIPGAPPAVIDHLEKSEILRENERVTAAIDDSWTGDASRGIVLTDRRVVAFRGRTVRFDLPLQGIERITARRMWYPSADFVGRGEFFGQGPVVVLRLKFRMKDGRTERFRLSTYANELYPLIAGLIDRLGEKVEVRRTLPGV